jgi:hypothetical protein
MSYGIRVRTAKQCTLLGSAMSANCAVAIVDLDYGGDVNAVQEGNVIIGLTASQGWIPPRAKNRAGWKYFEIGGAVNPFDRIYGAGSAGFPTTYADPSLTMVYADLPDNQVNVIQPGPFEGQEYNIIDSSLPAVGNFGVSISGGGSYHVKVRYSLEAPAGWKISG